MGYINIRYVSASSLSDNYISWQLNRSLVFLESHVFCFLDHFCFLFADHCFKIVHNFLIGGTRLSNDEIQEDHTVDDDCDEPHCPETEILLSR